MTRQLRNICMLMIKLRTGFSRSSSSAQVPDAGCAQPASILLREKVKGEKHLCYNVKLGFLKPCEVL